MGVSLMFLKSDFLKTVVCLALIFVLFSAPVGAVVVSDFTSLEQAVENGGSQVIYVNESFEMQCLSIPDGVDVTLKPDGQSVVLSFEDFNANSEGSIWIKEGGSLTLVGNNEYTITMKGSSSDANRISLIYNKGKFTIESGAILTDYTTTANYGGVRNKGEFIMNGGEISHIIGVKGGAVSLIGTGASFIMNDGIITENTANNGAGIYLSEGSVSITGGIISQNTGYDIEIVGSETPKTDFSISGDAVISSIHFQNTPSKNTVPSIHAASDFTGEVKEISYENYVPKTKAVDFQSSNAAQNLQNKFHIADEDYCLVPSGNYLIIESAPDFQFAIDNPTNIIIPKYPIKIPVSLEVTNGKVSMIVVTLTLSDYSGNQVQGISYDYNIKDGVKFDVIRKEGNTLTLSTGTDITQSIEDLLTLTISDADLAPGEYTVTLEIESSVSNTEDYTKYPTQTLKTTVNVVPLILAETANTNGADKLGTPVWSFKQKASVTYVISPFDASLEKKWPAVSRHASPDYSNTASELTEVKVYKSTAAYDSANQKSNQWIEASSTVSKNTDGTIKFNLATSDSDAKCFKIVFTGRKVGDVVEGTGDIDNVNLYDVDMILHAAVAPTIYIKPEWRLYADTNSDGKILLGDAINVFNFFKGYTA